MKNQLLTAISEIPNSAAYYMGQRDGYRQQIEEALNVVPIGGLQASEASLKDLYWLLDLANNNFAKEMGWL